MATSPFEKKYYPLKYEDVNFSNEAVNGPGLGGYYSDSKVLTVPQGYYPISAVYQSDFATGVYPIINRDNKVALNCSKSVTLGNNVIVRVFYQKLGGGNCKVTPCIVAQVAA